MTATSTLGKTNETLSPERSDILAGLRESRHFLRFTTRDLTDEQVTARPTPSELCLAGLVKHVTAVERGWVEFIVDGTSAMKNFDELTAEDYAARDDQFRLLPGETLAGILEEYAAVAARTDEMVATLPDLNAAWPLPQAPWFQEGEWSARRVLMHIIGETAQHAGHADIIREAIDGAKSMG